MRDVLLGQASRGKGAGGMFEPWQPGYDGECVFGSYHLG